MFGQSVSQTKLPQDHYQVANCPTDTISSIDWSPTANHLVATSWDCSINVYEIDDIGKNSKPLLSQNSNFPTLCSSFGPTGSSILFGGCDKAAHLWDLQSNSVTQVASHNEPISFCSFVPQHNMVCTGSWDGTLKYWDTRSPNPSFSVQLPCQVFCGEFKGNLGVISCNNILFVFDLAFPDKAPLEIKPTHIKSQIVSVGLFPQLNGFGYGGIDGRVQFHDFNDSTSSSTYAFRAHRSSNGDGHTVSVVNFNPTTGAALTCGGDGRVIVWDKPNKSKLKEYTPTNPLPITAGKYNADGRLLAYASGYDWQKMMDDYDKNKRKPSLIFTYCEKDVQPKSSR